jgi:hypothetical protein
MRLAEVENGGKGVVFTFAGGDLRPWLSRLYFADRILPEETPEALTAVAESAAWRGRAVYVAMIVDAGHPAGAEAERALATFERLSGRRREEMARWTDEGRATVLFRFGAAG